MPESRDERRIFRYASFLFLLSGFTGLAYEVIWFKRFAHVWGNSNLAMASVVASFLFGLALGAQIFGKWADRMPYPLRWYGICEAAIGILAFFIPFEIQFLEKVAAEIYPFLQQQIWLHTGVRFGLTFLVIGPPCFLMGGTLPLMIRQFSQSNSFSRETIGWFYAANTAGAALGCYLTGFYLLPNLGLLWTNMLAIVINLDIALSAWSLLKEWKKRLNDAGVQPTEAQNEEIPISAAAPSSLIVFSLYLGSAITGCAALILEMVWARQLALILGGTTYAFSAMLFVILVGIGLGSWVFHRRFHAGINYFHALALPITGLILFTAIGYWLIPALTLFTAFVMYLRFSQTFNSLICIMISSILELIPSFCMGCLFPLFVILVQKKARNIGRAVGSVYAWNTIGSIIGASLTSYLLIANWGSNLTILFALALYALALILLTPCHRWKGNILIKGGFLFSCAAILGSIQAHDPRITNVGMYMYGYMSIREVKHSYKSLFFQEGASCNVLVTDYKDHRAIRVNGKVDASNKADMPTQLGLAYYPRFLRPQAKNLLVIGFGSGTTVGASLLFPETRVTCCEIEPAIFQASSCFSDVNHSPERSPNLTMVFDDGRNYLHGIREQFDLIISEPSNPWIAGVSNLFTREFYQLTKSRLKSDGILMQWLQTYNFTLSDYAMIIRTIMDVFPHYGLVTLETSDTLLMASNAPIQTSKNELATMQSLIDSLPEVRQDLETHFKTKDVTSLMLSSYLLDEKGLQRFVELDDAQTLNTDINLRLEFDSPLRLFRPPEKEINILSYLLTSADHLWFTTNFNTWDCGKNQLTAWKGLTQTFDKIDLPRIANPLAQFGIVAFPEEPYFLAETLKWIAPTESRFFTNRLNILLPLSPSEAHSLGIYLKKVKQYQRAIEVFEGVLKHQPEWATTWTHLALTYQLLGNRSKAEEAFRKALSIDPFNDFTKTSYDKFLGKNEDI